VRVDGHVHDDLFNLSSVRLHRFKSGGGSNAPVRSWARQMAQSAFDAGKNGVQIEDFRLENVFAPVSQKLTRQGRGPVGGFADFSRAVVEDQHTPVFVFRNTHRSRSG